MQSRTIIATGWVYTADTTGKEERRDTQVVTSRITNYLPAFDDAVAAEGKASETCAAAAEEFLNSFRSRLERRILTRSMRLASASSPPPSSSSLSSLTLQLK